MNLLKILTIIISFLIGFSSFAEQEASKVVEESARKQLNVEGVNFEDLSREQKIGCLKDVVQDKNSLDDYLETFMTTQIILHPYTQGLSYVNGILCYVAYYSQSIVYTVLEGPQYGLQVIFNYQGLLLYVNGNYAIEYTPIGAVFHHYYSDSEVITGANQVILFH